LNHCVIGDLVILNLRFVIADLESQYLIHFLT